MSPNKQRYPLQPRFYADSDDSNRSGYENNLSMEDDDCADVAVSSPRRASVMSHHPLLGAEDITNAAAATTPTKSRRLFWEGGESKPPARRVPLAWNPHAAHHHPALNESVESTSSASTSSMASLAARRKRSSAERLATTPVPPPTEVNVYASPRISPNSFLTMDGRFVQSKNPFSSPMMTDTPLTATPHPSHADPRHGTAPSVPGLFGASREHDATVPPLWPKQMTPVTDATAGLRACSLSMDTDATASSSSAMAAHARPGSGTMFTCSPILEHVATTAGAWTAMESNVASAGSLHKVRRLHRSDDVVAATAYHLQRLAAHPTRDVRPPPTCDTMMTDDTVWEDESPTDVVHFFPTPRTKPGPPPTPMKQRPVWQPYSGHPRNSSSNYLLPRTPHAPPPLLPRKTMNLYTPHMEEYSSTMYEETMSDFDSNGYHIPGGTGARPRHSNSRFHADFDVIGELGRGSFGNVYKVLSRLDGCMYAIKKAHRQAKGTADRDRMLKEVYALAALSDQADTANFHIVRYHQAWIEDDRLYIQTELCTGTLGDEIGKGLLTVSRTYKLLREMLLALDFIHRHNMVHLDIKPDNIFLKNDQYKLGDFGLVTKLSASQDVEEGDSRYMSMELLSGDGNCDLTKSDVFSLGATMYELCLRRPLPMNGQEWQDIRAGRLSNDLPNLVDAELASIIRRMMDPAGYNRPSPSSLLKHPQLLSDEQKALNIEKTKVIHANLQLAVQQQRLGLAPKRQLTRANTWNGSSLPHM